ncbi:MAG: molybdenum cofactor guanylyltransferase MobA [Beijerinckiaceae bacterium]|nr:molybdenum cofactor guanylyltransferase MobA [Beijerinckiaceae bacterium]
MIGVILAGGRSSRMGGGDKGLRALGGGPVLDRVIATMRAQCDDLLLNANGDANRFESYGLPVAPDDLPDYPGPLAGVLAGLDWVAAHRPRCLFVVTAPADTPFIPKDFVARLQDVRAEDRALITCARSGGVSHSIAALWQVALRHDLRKALAQEGLRKVTDFLARHPVAYADWPVRPYDPFFNINTPEDLATAEAIAAGR